MQTGVASISVTPTELDLETITERAAALTGSADVLTLGEREHVIADTVIGDDRLRRAYWRLLDDQVLLMVRAVVLVADQQDVADQRTLLDASVATIGLVEDRPSADRSRTPTAGPDVTT